MADESTGNAEATAAAPAQGAESAGADVIPMEERRAALQNAGQRAEQVDPEHAGELRDLTGKADQELAAGRVSEAARLVEDAQVDHAQAEAAAAEEERRAA